MQPHVATNVPVSPAQFVPLSVTPVQVNDANIGLILDVPLQVTVELGRTRKSIKEILELTNGSIENFGVRITEIASPAERAAQLQ